MRVFHIYLKIITNLLLISCIISVAGCALNPPPPAPPSIPSERIYLHTVNFAGENLPMISEWYTGSYMNWRKIRSFNGHLQSFLLSKGSTVRIPESLAIQTIPMTQEFVTKRKTAYVSRAKNSYQAKLKRSDADTGHSFGEHGEPQIEIDDAPMQDELIENLLPDSPKG